MSNFEHRSRSSGIQNSAFGVQYYLKYKLGVPADRSGPRYPFIRLQALRTGPVSTAIANAEFRKNQTKCYCGEERRSKLVACKENDELISPHKLRTTPCPQ